MQNSSDPLHYAMPIDDLEPPGPQEWTPELRARIAAHQHRGMLVPGNLIGPGFDPFQIDLPQGLSTEQAAAMLKRAKLRASGKVTSFAPDPVSARAISAIQKGVEIHEALAAEYARIPVQQGMSQAAQQAIRLERIRLAAARHAERKRAASTRTAQRREAKRTRQAHARTKAQAARRARRAGR